MIAAERIVARVRLDRTEHASVAEARAWLRENGAANVPGPATNEPGCLVSLAVTIAGVEWYPHRSLFDALEAGDVRAALWSSACSLDEQALKALRAAGEKTPEGDIEAFYEANRRGVAREETDVAPATREAERATWLAPDEDKVKAAIELATWRAERAQERARSTLLHYLALAGVQTTGDCGSEIRGFVDDVVEAAVARAAAAALAREGT